ncbi:MAG: substrate-binding domain-containing protein [Myxococcales bacterium]
MTPKASPRIGCSLREFRLARKLSQAELAGRVSLSRQALIAIESGAAVPGTDVALRLAQALGVRVETLFHFEGATPEVEARLAGAAADLDLPPGGSSRVVLAEIDGRWVAHPLSSRGPDGPLMPADGLAHLARQRRRGKTVRVEALSDLELARKQLVVMGCAPALGLLAARLRGEPSGVRLSWVQGPSTAALDALARGEIHVAGIHLLDEATGRYNVPLVRRRFPDRRMLLVNLATWEQGIVVAAGNPLKLRTAADLLRPKVRFVARESGAGAHRLLERALRGQHLRADRLRPAGPTASGHLEVAQRIALGAADAGIAIRGAALAFGLDFIPLAEERFDLVFPRELATDPRIERLVDTLGSQSFRRELDCVGGYSTVDSGHPVGDTGADEREDG